MELRHLRYFVAVAEEQNVTRAAARLHVSQPPLSRQIRDLELELGCDLFERTGKAVRLTESGRVFLTEACAVLRHVDDAVQKVRAVAAGSDGEFHVGYAPSPTVEILPGILREFRAKAPKRRVILHDLASPEMLSGLRNGKLHVSLMVQQSRHATRGILFEKLRSYPIIAAVPHEHPFARLRLVRVADAIEEPMVVYSRQDFPDYHEMIKRIAGPLAKRFRIIEECDGVMSLIAAIESGKGIALSAASLANTAGARLQYIPVEPTPAPVVVGVAYRDGALDSARKLFLEAAKTAVQEERAQNSGPKPRKRAPAQQRR